MSSPRNEYPALHRVEGDFLKVQKDNADQHVKIKEVTPKSASGADVEVEEGLNQIENTPGRHTDDESDLEFDDFPDKIDTRAKRKPYILFGVVLFAFLVGVVGFSSYRAYVRRHNEAGETGDTGDDQPVVDEETGGSGQPDQNQAEDELLPQEPDHQDNVVGGNSLSQGPHPDASTLDDTIPERAENNDTNGGKLNPEPADTNGGKLNPDPAAPLQGAPPAVEENKGNLSQATMTTTVLVNSASSTPVENDIVGATEQEQQQTPDLQQGEPPAPPTAEEVAQAQRLQQAMQQARHALESKRAAFWANVETARGNDKQERAEFIKNNAGFYNRMHPMDHFNNFNMVDITARPQREARLRAAAMREAEALSISKADYNKITNPKNENIYGFDEVLKQEDEFIFTLAERNIISDGKWKQIVGLNDFNVARNVEQTPENKKIEYRRWVREQESRDLNPNKLDKAKDMLDAAAAKIQDEDQGVDVDVSFLRPTGP